MSALWARLLPGGILVAFLSLCFWRMAAHPGDLLVDGERATIDGALQPDARAIGNDLTRMFLPHHARIAAQVAKGRLPSAWDPYGFGGRPRVGNPQAGLFYPPVWLAWLAWSPSSLTWLTMAHLLWGGMGAFALARSVRLTRAAATITSLVFAGSPYVLAQVFEGHYPHVWSATWYPWAFMAAQRLRVGDLRGALWLPPILALSFLAGHPQEAYYLVLALAVWMFSDAIGTAWRTVRERCERFVSAVGVWRRHRRLGVAELAFWQDVTDDVNDREPGAHKTAVGKRQGRLGSRALVGGALLLMTAGLIAVELLPDASAAAWTLRAKRETVFEAGRYHVVALNLLQMLSPAALGGPTEYIGHESYWETMLSIGWAPMVLLIFALFCSTRRREVRAWGVLLALALVFAAGWRGGLFMAMHAVVPGVSRFRAPARALFLAALAAAMLVGLGVDALKSRRLRGQWWKYYRGFVLALIAVLIIATAVGLCMNRNKNPYSRVAPSAGPVIQAEPRHDREPMRWVTGCVLVTTSPSFWVAMTGTTGLLYWLKRRPGTAARVAFAFGLLVFGELAWNGACLLKTARPEIFWGDDPLARATASQNQPTPFRVRARDAFYSDLRAQQAGLEKVNINDSFQIQHAADLYESLYSLFRPVRPSWPRQPMSGAVDWYHAEVRQAVLDRMGVAFLMSDRPWPSATWPVVASGVWQGSPYLVYRNTSALPRAYVVPRATVAGDDPLEVIGSRGHSPRETVVMSSDPLPAAGERQPFTPASYDGSDPDRVVIEVQTERPGLLVVADAWMPGWTAHVDGERGPVLRGDHAHRVVALQTAGWHRIVMRYTPPGLWVGLVISAVSAMSWVILMLWAVKRGRRARTAFLTGYRESRHFAARTTVGLTGV